MAVALVAPRARRWRWLAGLFVTVLATIPAWSPLLDPYLDLWRTDDAPNHLLRLYHFGWLLEHGVWYPRWSPDMYLGYGYPMFNFYAPGFYYLAWVTGKLLHLGVWNAFRATGIEATLIVATGMFALVTGVFRRVLLGVFAALTVVYGPYTVVLNLYKRGDLPELLALALIPWLLFAIWRLWTAERRGAAALWTLLAGVTGAATLFVHNLTGLFAAGLAGALTVALALTRLGGAQLARVAAAGVLALGLSAVFWLPSVAEARLVQLDRLTDAGRHDYHNWLVPLGTYHGVLDTTSNRQSPTGAIDTHLVYPHQVVIGPKISLGQAGMLAMSVAALLVFSGMAIRRRR